MPSILRVQIGNPPLKQPALVHLNLEDNLSKIRIELGKNAIINMNDKLSFARKVSNNVIGSYEFSEITHEDESKFRLSDIREIMNNDNVLYLIESLTKPIWEFINEKCKLDYGRAMTNDGIKRAYNRTFIMKDCECTEFGAEGCQNGEVEFNSKKKEDWMMKTNLFFTTDNKVQNFVNLGLSVGTLNAEGFQWETSLSYHYTNYAKLSMKFSKFLEPTPEFINAVEDAIKSKNPENFIRITEKFGQFVPSEVILGGSVYFEKYKESTEYIADEANMDLDSTIVKSGKISNFNHKRVNLKNLKSNYKKLIGGEQSEKFEYFDEKAESSWIKSLNDYKSWDCIEFKDPISIFHLLSDELRKQIFSLVGKKILYLNTIDYDFQFNESGEPNIVELKIPLNISKIIQSEDAECSTFATVVDTEKSKNGYFNCQIYCPPPNRKPSLIIHCIQKRFKKRKYKLKISIMVIGYDTDFKDFSNQFYVLKQDYNSLATMINTELLNFEYDPYIRKSCLGIPVLSNLDSSNDSLVIGHYFFNPQEENKIGLCTFAYCLKNKHYVNLPDFTFYTLIISNYHIRNAYGTIPFNYSFMKKPYISLNNLTGSSSSNPKFISLYSKILNHGPIFLKQKINQIKIKYVDCKCKICSICVNKIKISEYFIECAFFDPFISNTSYDISTSSEKYSASNSLTAEKMEKMTKMITTSNADIKRYSTNSSISTGKLLQDPQIPNITKKATITNNQQVIQQLKLNHGLFLDGYNVRPSKQAIFLENGLLSISLYNGQPIVYTNINDPVSSENLLNFNSDDDFNSELQPFDTCINDDFNDFNNELRPSDACINFPIAEITYEGDLLESFSRYNDYDEDLYRLYGHLYARKILIGGKLFIKDLSLAASTQIDLFKSQISWAYNSAKYNMINPFNDLSDLHFLPKISTLDGEQLNTLEKISNWMNNLYQKNMFDIISYDNLVPISQLKLKEDEDNFVTLKEKQSGVANFKEKLNFEEWIGNAAYVNLIRWIKDFHLLQGLIINKYHKIEISKEIAINFIKIPTVKSSNESYLEMIKPTTKIEEFLIFNNICLEDISTVPFVNEVIKSDNLIYSDYNFLVKFERYEIHMNGSDIRPSVEFEQAIINALKEMKPFKALQGVFDKYGHLFPQKIILGRFFNRNLQTNSLGISDKFDLKSPIYKSLKPYLDKLNSPYLLTRKGNVIEESELSDLIQNLNNDLEIVGYGNVIPLYKILEKEQQEKINIILDNYKIIMTGITDLEGLDDNNTEHYKRIKISPSLEDKNYEVFGSIISNENNLKLEEFLVNFRLYDFNGFSVMVKALKKTDIKISKCHVLWMIVGNPSKLSVFSPKNQDIQVKYEKSIKLQPNELKNDYYDWRTPYPLSQGYIVSVNAYYSPTTYEHINIKLVEWSKNCIKFQITEPDYDNQHDLDNANAVMSNIYCNICIIYDCNTFKIDKEKKEDKEEKKDEYPLDLIGLKLSDEIFNNILVLSNPI